MEADKLPVVAATVDPAKPYGFTEFGNPVCVYGRYRLACQPSLG